MPFAFIVEYDGGPDPGRDELIQNRIGWESSASGACMVGAPVRDLEFVFDDAASARQAHEAALALKRERLVRRVLPVEPIE